ncbi:sulfur carrier protein ThiS [Pontibacillus yanchengensis]|uniref:Thiamine biosynthesis protein ThiS n=1 Tax=Pontibacillus yanchengensis Y32 TaxID=1385514 RepID=A0A0A2TNR1_9BACI|nr:sulfur carrier protein ThiS [Pontibacillus yanchengensis]KGP70965.1 thiamine biosynthesis protein ThiS [Pontibacillus yanchengensis Y32]
MKIQINGNKVEMPDEVRTIEELLVYYKLDDKPVIVEWNKEIVDKDNHTKTVLTEEDQVEIVHFVGGG